MRQPSKRVAQPSAQPLAPVAPPAVSGRRKSAQMQTFGEHDDVRSEGGEFWQGTMDALEDHIAVLDANGTIVAINEAWRAFGRKCDGSRGAVGGIGENYLSACATADGDLYAIRAASGLRALLAGQIRNFTMEYPCRGPHQERWFILRATRISGPGPVRVLTAHEDVTERRLMEGRAHTQATLLDEIDVAVVATDATGAVTHWNHGAEILYGWTRSEAAGRQVSDLIVRQGAPLPLVPDDAPRDQHRWEGRFAVRRKDGTIFPAHVRETLTDDGTGEPTGMIGVSMDISAEVAAAAELASARNQLAADASARRAELERISCEVTDHSWATRLRDALSEDRFVLHAQPVLDLRTNEIVQHELLLRMRDPDGAVIGPTPYLRIAEEHGLIGDIDRWVIDQALALAANGSRVELNVAGGSITDPRLIQHLESGLDRLGVDPALLIFDVAETAIVNDEAAALRFARRLHELGCRLALDDFGTGLGGFTYLKRLPIDLLKIDVEFVQDLRVTPASQHVVEAVVNLAGRFGLQTVAEGVEDAETLQHLRDMGVDLAQGFHIARPAPITPIAPV
jgi:PAS domain S-box-containing protein